MPIICSGVNRASQEKLVPITRENCVSIVPNRWVGALKLVKGSPENGPLQELVAKLFKSASYHTFVILLFIQRPLQERLLARCQLTFIRYWSRYFSQSLIGYCGLKIWTGCLRFGRHGGRSFLMLMRTLSALIPWLVGTPLRLSAQV